MAAQARPVRRSTDALDGVRERQESIEAARVTLARSEARVRHTARLLALADLVLARTGHLRFLPRDWSRETDV